MDMNLLAKLIAYPTEQPIDTVTLFAPGESEFSYNKSVRQIKAGTMVQIGDYSFHIRQKISEGNHTMVFETMDGLVLRLANFLHQLPAMDEYAREMLIANHLGIASPEVYVYEKNKFCLVEKIEIMAALYNYYYWSRRELREDLLIKMDEAIDSFARQVAPLVSMPDTIPKNIVFTRDGRWMILDAGYKMSVNPVLLSQSTAMEKNIFTPHRDEEDIVNEIPEPIYLRLAAIIREERQHLSESPLIPIIQQLHQEGLVDLALP